ncbi:MAG: thiamine phosphate synthase [Eubacteriales bacterium]|jgi:thiamine-phosphate pyrophosphorylase
MNWNVKQAMKVYLVTDRTWLNGRTLEEVVEEALKGGATCVQLREKHTSHEEFLQLALQLKKLTARYQVPLLINDDVEIALEADADGVHIGQSDMKLAEARAKLGADKIIGVTCNRVELALEAQKNGADYLGVGAVFGSSTKLDAKPLDHQVLQDICEAVSIPVVAIGGISLDNVSQLQGRGMDGVAVISGILAQPDIEAATASFRQVTDQWN